MFLYYAIICFLIGKSMHFIRQSFIEHFIVPFLIGCHKYYIHIHLLAFVLNIIPLPLCATSIQQLQCNKVCHAVDNDYWFSLVWFGLAWNSLIVLALPLGNDFFTAGCTAVDWNGLLDPSTSNKPFNCNCPHSPPLHTPPTQ